MLVSLLTEMLVTGYLTQSFELIINKFGIKVARLDFLGGDTSRVWALTTSPRVKIWEKDRIVSHDAPRFMLYYHCVRDTSWSLTFSTREVNIDRSARCGWFPNMFRFSSFCFWDYRVGLYSLSFKGEFQRYFDQEGFYMYFTDLSRTPLCARSHCKHKVQDSAIDKLR